MALTCVPRINDFFAPDKREALCMSIKLRLQACLRLHLASCLLSSQISCLEQSVSCSLTQHAWESQMSCSPPVSDTQIVSFCHDTYRFVKGSMPKASRAKKCPGEAVGHTCMNGCKDTIHCKVLPPKLAAFACRLQSGMSCIQYQMPWQHQQLCLNPAAQARTLTPHKLCVLSGN